MKDFIIVGYEDKKIKLKYYYIVLFNLLIIGMTYGVLTRTSYSMDSYLTINKVDVSMHLLYGRFINYIIGILLNALDISPFLNQSIFIILFIVILSIITTALVKITNNLLLPITPIKLFLINFSILLSFVNIFFLEWFLYPESIPFTIIHMILTCIAIIIISKSFKISNILISLILLCISVNMYPIEMGLFVIICLTFILLKNGCKLYRTSLIKTLIILSMGLVSSIVNVIIAMVLKKTGMSPPSSKEINLDISLIINNIGKLYESHKNIWLNGLHLMPNGIIMIFGIILLILLITSIIKSKLKIKDIFFVCFILLVNYLIIFAPHIILTEVWTTQRTMVGFFMFLTSVLLIIIALNKNIKINCTLLFVLCIFLAFNFIFIQYIEVDHYASNKIDEEFTILVYNKILDYENETEQEIKKIATKRDINPSWSYSSIQFVTYETNLRGFIIEWDDVGMINYYSGRNFEKVPMDNLIYNKYFMDKDWTYLKLDEQMVFNGDTLYMIIY